MFHFSSVHVQILYSAHHSNRSKIGAKNYTFNYNIYLPLQFVMFLFPLHLWRAVRLHSPTELQSPHMFGDRLGTSAVPMHLVCTWYAPLMCVRLDF